MISSVLPETAAGHVSLPTCKLVDVRPTLLTVGDIVRGRWGFARNPKFDNDNELAAVRCQTLLARVAGSFVADYDVAEMGGLLSPSHSTDDETTVEVSWDLGGTCPLGTRIAGSP